MSNFIDYPELFIEDTELNSMIRLLDTQGYRNLLVQMTETFGIFKRVRDNGFTALQVYNSSSGEIGVYAGLAFDNSGNFINVKNNLPDLFAIPNDNTYRRVFIQYAQTQVEVGTINIAINGTITGVGTLFTQIFKPGKNIEIINSTHGNNGVYEVLSVNNDTLMLVNFNFVNAENNLNFKFQGVYTPSVTIPDSNKRPYWYDSYLITLQADNITETDSMFCLGRVINSLGVLTITDVRDKIHLFKSSYIPEFNSAYTTASTFKVGALTGGTGGQEVLLENTNYQVPKFPRINDISGFNLKNLDASFYNNNEINMLKSIQLYSDKEIKCLIWSAKEALVKYLKIGFTVPIEILEINSVSSTGNILSISFKNFPALTAFAFTINNIIVTLCVLKSVNISITDLKFFSQKANALID